MNFHLLLSFALPYRRKLIVASLLAFAEVLVTLSIPWLGGQMVADVFGNEALAGLGVAWLLLVLVLCQSLLRFAFSYLTGVCGDRILADLRNQVYEHLLALPLSFFQRMPRGDILALLSYESSQLASFITGTLVNLAPLLLTVFGALGAMLHADKVLGLALGLSLPSIYILLKLVGRRLHQLTGKIYEEYAAAFGTAEEHIGLLSLIKAFTGEKKAAGDYAERNTRIVGLSRKRHLISAALQPAIQVLAAASLLGVIVVAGERIRGGAMGTAELVSFSLYALLLLRPLGMLANVYGDGLQARRVLERLQRVFSEPREKDAPFAIEFAQTPAGHIEFERVSFAYPENSPVLREVNFAVRAGEIVAITGLNGVGKSTLLQLLLRFHEPSAGQIRIDGINIADVSLHSLRQQISIVPQTVMLFNASVMDNIAYGNTVASELDIFAAAKLAQADEFIRRLPEGYHTVIGDQGAKLSGGQRQRLALARALLKNTPILVLDEATAMFDPEGEVALVEDCRDLFQGRTVIIITHRPASLALAHRVLRLVDGGFIAQ